MHLPAEECQAIRGILADTLPEFAEIASTARSASPRIGLATELKGRRP
jgi:hypothetical protein